MTCRNCAKNIYNGGGCHIIDDRYYECLAFVPVQMQKQEVKA